MKKILLTSKGLSNKKIENAFLDLLEFPIDSKKVCIIPTAAIELKQDHPRIVQAKEAFLKLGFKTVDFVDIEIDTEIDTVEPLSSYDVIYLGGGNPYYLLKHLKQTGAGQIIKEKALNGTVIIGVSAGALVLGPHIKVVEHFTPNLKDETIVDDSGLGLFSFPIMPHYDREDIFPDDTSIEQRLRGFEEQLKQTVERIKDDQTIVLKNEEVIRL